MNVLVLFLISLLLCSCGKTKEIEKDTVENPVKKETAKSSKKNSEEAKKPDVELVEARKFIYKTEPYGKVKVIYSNTSGYINNGIITLIIAPPYKYCYWLNPDNKTYLERKLTVTKAQYSKIVKRKKAKVCGFKCTAYDCYKNPKFKVGTFYCTREFKLHPELSNLLCETIGVPTGYGFPIKTIGITLNAQKFLTLPGVPLEKATLLELLKVEDTKVNPSMFLLPSDYKKATSPLEFIFSESGSMSEKDVEDLFEHHFKKK